MEKMKKKAKNENEDIKRIQENCELVSKYFFEMDKKLLGKSAIKELFLLLMIWLIISIARLNFIINISQEKMEKILIDW